ncbi:MAG: D-alanine--D-alanine ligase [Saccharofermentans sp.]|jgi:D-alanine-D-alanine ligase|nr:D-alanine--D-alanine ligase [Mageeibacillus sp.]MCI1264334.1 D-alanine--D-alanine ligase [Saccharofermentans sp.]MCI1275586.1 D-alanine--D-alanine ligase [Saccharofermentans sp.]
MKITVLGGGLSPERDVSLKSASLIANALLSKGHEVALVDLYDGIENDRPAESFFRRGTVEPFTYDIPETEPDLEAIIKSHGGRREWVGPRVIEMCRFADRVFLGLHGSHGENGQVQAVLDAFGVRYTGCGYLGCAIAMDKDVSKALISGAGYKTAAWITDKAEKLDFDRVNERIGLPCVVKPIGCGSSCGVSIVKTREEFEAAIALAASYKQLVVVEQFIKGREITISVVNHRALPITEIIPHEGFYDYKNKYQDGMTTHVCPAHISGEDYARGQALAVEMFDTLRMNQYGRIDMIYDDVRHEFWFIEANNLPGMTSTSLLPEAAKADGISYEDLCERIIMNCGEETI